MAARPNAPSGWSEVPLGDIAREANDRHGDGRERHVYSMTKHRGFVPSSEYFDRQVFSRDLSNYKVVRSGQFAYATIHLDEGAIDLFEFDEGLISPMYTVFEVDATQVDAQFLRLLLKSDAYIHRYGQLGQGTVNRRKSIGFESLAKLRIRMPSLAIQHKIVEVVSGINEVIKATRAVIEQTRRLKSALLQELLTKGLPGRHKKFITHHKLGRVPADWTQKTLNDVVDRDRPVCYGILMPGRGHPGGVPVVKVKDLVDGRIDESDILLTSPELDEEFRRSRLRTGDILLSIRGTTGRVAIVPATLNNANITQDTARLSVADDDVRDFLYYLLQSFPLQQQIQHHTIGQAVKGINIEEVRKLPVALPGKEELHQIVGLFHAVEERLQHDSARLDQLQRTKSALSQGLLTGKIPVSIPAAKLAASQGRDARKARKD